MSTEQDDNASTFTSQSDLDSDQRQSTGSNMVRPPRKKSRSSAKPRLSVHQKNTNHKDAENKRRNAIRERFTELSTMVPGTAGQERSEQVMLQKTSEFLRCQMGELRQLERMAHERGIDVDKDAEALKDSDYGGRHWRELHMEEYREQRERKKPIATSPSPPISPSTIPNPRSKRKASTLLASASKILKPSSAKGQKLPDRYGLANLASSTPLPTLKKTKTPPSHIPIKRRAYVSPLPIALSTRPSTSPAEKPLPSLPVATVLGKSPIQRRSLIDATERPLRRSASLPPPGQVSAIAEEEWPALSPYRPALNQYDSRLARPIKASVGESVIEAMRDLHIGNQNAPTAIKGSSSQSTTPALPRPTGCRKPKTSDSRLRQSTASSGDEIKLREDNHTQTNLPRSRSILHTATGRGSPYTLVTNSSNESLRHPRPPSPESTTSLHTAKLVAVKEAKAIATAPGKPRTSIPIPTRVIRRLPNDHSEADAPNVKLRRGSHASQEPNPSDADVDANLDADIDANIDANVDADIDANADADHKSAKSTSPPSATTSQIKPPFKHAARIRTTGKMTFAELMATPAPTEQELLHASPDPNHSSSDQASVRGYDSDGGFKIKKIRRRGRRPGTSAATLRISDSAQKLLGEDSERAHRLASSSSHLTKTSDIIKSKIQLPRSITSRSIARLSSAAMTEPTVNVKDGDAGDDTVIKYSQSQESFAQSKQPILSIHTNVAAAAADTPQNPIHRDWPLKELNSLAAATTTATTTRDRDYAPSSGRASSDSSWIPPVDWEVKKRPSTVDLPSHFTMPVSTSNAAPTRNHFSSPTPAPLSFRRPASTERGNGNGSGNGYLSPIHEMSEHTLASVLGRHDSQNTLRYFAPSTPKTTAAMVSALRNLFHKKSSELGRGDGSIRSSNKRNLAAAHLLTLAVAAARDAENALAQARLAVTWCEDCVERTSGVVAELRMVVGLTD
ncbi:hypothetical protein DV736_g813, partial [Chaetothyriales sp. CBS 134916]